MLLTYEMLRAKKACKNQADKFRALFPAGVVLTEALCVAHASDFDFCWAATNLLSATALEAYKQARAAALEAYEQACAPAWEAHEQACATALEAYEQACAPAWEAYKQARAAAREAYEQARATAFFAGWQADNAP